MIEVFHNFQEETIPVQTNVNIFIACFTISYACLKLYDALDTLQERLLYMHTDSVIYIQKPGEPSIPTGNYLRQYTNELDEGDHIVEFVVAGPKNYAFNTKQGKQTCKVRGFTLNVRGCPGVPVHGGIPIVFTSIHGVVTQFVNVSFLCVPVHEDTTQCAWSEHTPFCKYERIGTK